MAARATLATYRRLQATHWSLQYASGLFADKGWRRAWSALVPGAGQTLALLGNCCSVATDAQREESAEFLRRCSAAWQTVYLVPGPHEISSSEGAPFFKQIDALKGVVKKAAGAKENVYLMQHSEHTLLNKDIVVLAATGWTGAAPCGETSTIWKLPGELATSGMFHAWHQEDLGWLRERNNWWGTHHPEVRKVILTHYHPYFMGQQQVAEDICLPIDSVRPILGLQPPYSPYTWLSGAGNIVASGMVRHSFLAANSALNKQHYMADRRLEVPLRRGDPPLLRPQPVLPHAGHSRVQPQLQ
jgi:hypothetical protein